MPSSCGAGWRPAGAAAAAAAAAEHAASMRPPHIGSTPTQYSARLAAAHVAAHAAAAHVAAAVNRGSTARVPASVTTSGGTTLPSERGVATLATTILVAGNPTVTVASAAYTTVTSTAIAHTHK